VGRVLAVDFGERRIGVAISDPSRTIAQPLETLRRRPGKRPPFTALLELVKQWEVDAIVVGLPLTLAGDDSDWTREVRDFAEGLGRRTGLSVSLADERMTSVMAERAVRSLGLPRGERERKDRIDAAAAMIILQAFLDAGARTQPVEKSDDEAAAF
jgi:putative holliday junction resolvase